MADEDGRRGSATLRRHLAAHEVVHEHGHQGDGEEAETTRRGFGAGEGVEQRPSCASSRKTGTKDTTMMVSE